MYSTCIHLDDVHVYVHNLCTLCIHTRIHVHHSPIVHTDGHVDVCVHVVSLIHLSTRVACVRTYIYIIYVRTYIHILYVHCYLLTAMFKMICCK